MAKFMRLWEQVKHFKVNIMNYDVFLRICAIALAIVHFVLMVAMRLSGRMFLTFVNIFSISLYLTAFYYAGKNRIKLVYYMFVTEILLYSKGSFTRSRMSSSCVCGILWSWGSARSSGRGMNWERTLSGIFCGI